MLGEGGVRKTALIVQLKMFQLKAWLKNLSFSKEMVFDKEPPAD